MQNEFLGILFTPAPDNRPEIPRPLTYGACRFCGQAQSVTECYSEDAANEQATRHCDCGDAQIYQDRLRAFVQREADLQRVNSNLKSLFGSIRPETMELMQKAAEAVYDRKVVNASIKLSDMVSAKISRNSKGNIAIGDGKFQGNFAKAAQPDFKGVLCGGRMIAFEAKHSADDRINQSRVTAEQTTALDSYERAGAMCFVFVSLKMQDFFLIPWIAWKSMNEWAGRKYTTAEEMAIWRVRFDGQKIKFLHEEDKP